MSRTWKREPTRRDRDWFDDFDRQKHVAKKAPKLCLVGTISSEVTDEMESGDLTWTRRKGHA